MEAPAKGRLLGFWVLALPLPQPPIPRLQSKRSQEGWGWATDPSCSVLGDWGNLVLNSRGILTSLKHPLAGTTSLLPHPQCVPAEGQGGQQGKVESRP